MVRRVSVAPLLQTNPGSQSAACVTGLPAPTSEFNPPEATRPALVRWEPPPGTARWGNRLRGQPPDTPPSQRRDVPGWGSRCLWSTLTERSTVTCVRFAPTRTGASGAQPRRCPVAKQGRPPWVSSGVQPEPASPCETGVRNAGWPPLRTPDGAQGQRRGKAKRPSACGARPARRTGVPP